MSTRDLSAADRDLLGRARSVIRDRVTTNTHHVGAAVRTTDGDVYTGVHLETDVGRAAVCAEPVAIGQALTEAATRIDAVVAVRHDEDAERAGDAPEIVPPCGICRELIYDYGPDATVIVRRDDSPVGRPIAEMLPERESYGSER